MAQIMDAVDDRSPAERERFFASYRRGARGDAHDMWHDFSKKLYGFLADMSLEDFVRSQAPTLSVPTSVRRTVPIDMASRAA